MAYRLFDLAHVSKGSVRMRTGTYFVPPFTCPGRVCDTFSHVSKCHRVRQTAITDRKSLGSRKCYICACSDHHGLSRRDLVAFTIASAFAAFVWSSPSQAQEPSRRTVFDEERELHEKAKKVAEEARIGALRASFDAVQKASAQLDDLEALIGEGNWDRVRQFTRLFNNSVEREGMEVIAKKLENKADRKAATAVSKSLTEALILIDRCAREKDKDSALVHVQEARDIVSSFQSFKP